MGPVSGCMKKISTEEYYGMKARIRELEEERADLARRCLKIVGSYQTMLYGYEGDTSDVDNLITELEEMAGK